MHTYNTIVQELLLMPQPLTVFVGENATFDCVGPEGTTNYQWTAYNSDGIEISTTDFGVPEDRLFSSRTYRNVQFNTIHTVQCTVTVNGTVVPSENVTLKVIGKYPYKFVLYL